MKMKKLILLIAALALAACASLNASADQSELSLNQQKWQDANISHYRYNLAISCFCVFTQDMPLIIEVQDGEVVSMEYSIGNAIDSSSLEYFQSFSTIDRIFEQPHKDSDGEADEVGAAHEATHGSRHDVKNGYVKDATDDVMWFFDTDFAALP